MTYLHASALISIGNLTSHTCLIASNFILKISEYGLYFFRTEEDLSVVYDPGNDDEAVEERNFESLLWRAPELMRQRMPPTGTQVRQP